MMKANWDGMIRALVLVRIGQELGTDSKAARMVHDVLEFMAAVPISLFF